MTARGADPKGQSEIRSGTGALTLLAVPLNGTILQALSAGPKRLIELRKDSGSAPQTTVRTHLIGLEEAGLTFKGTRKDSPGLVECTLTSAGEDLLVVVASLELWLEKAPDGPLEFGSPAGKMAIKALLGGWSSTIMATLAAGPLSLGQLAGDIREVSYPALERRLAAMRLAGLILTSPAKGAGTPYGLTDWLRQGVAPLAAAVRWERSHFPGDTPAMTRVDTEAAFLLALPLLRMSSELAGSCRMGVEMGDDDERLCGAIASVAKGKVVASTVDLEGSPDSWASGPIVAWGQAMLGEGRDLLDLGGDKSLAVSLLAGLQGELFGGQPADTGTASPST